MKKLLFIFFISLFLCSVVQAQAPLKRPERKAKQEKVQVVKPRKANKTKITSSVKPVKEVKVDTVVVLSKPDTVYLERKPDTVYMERIQVAESKPDTKSVSGTINGHDYVDLGLPSGLKWATMNVGASSPVDYGDYFAWGEVETKSEYSWKTINGVMEQRIQLQSIVPKRNLAWLINIDYYPEKTMLPMQIGVVVGIFLLMMT